jgi:hypothetical protein
MKRARATKSSSAITPPTLATPPPDAILDWIGIVRTIATHEMTEVLETSKEGQKRVASYIILSDPTMEADSKPELSGECVFLPPTQYQLLCGTDKRVLDYRTEEMLNDEFAVAVHQGRCEVKSVALVQFLQHGSIRISLEFDDFHFDSACYFGTSCCKRAAESNAATRQWQGEEGYCKGYWLGATDSRYFDCKLHGKSWLK